MIIITVHLMRRSFWVEESSSALTHGSWNPETSSLPGKIMVSFLLNRGASMKTFKAAAYSRACAVIPGWDQQTGRYFLAAWLLTVGRWVLRGFYVGHLPCRLEANHYPYILFPRQDNIEPAVVLELASCTRCAHDPQGIVSMPFVVRWLGPGSCDLL